MPLGTLRLEIVVVMSIFPIAMNLIVRIFHETCTIFHIVYILSFEEK